MWTKTDGRERSVEKEESQNGRQLHFDDENELQRTLRERDEVDVHSVHQKRRNMFVFERFHAL